MNEIEKELIDQLGKVNKMIEEQVKRCKTFLEDKSTNWIEFKIDDIDIDKFTDYKNKGGIYYLQIRFNNNFETINKKSEIFKFLAYEWKWDDREYTPNIIQRRQEKYKIEQLKSNDWIPFYIGKSEKFENRMEEHFNKESKCKTYGLKLNCVENNFFKGCSYRIKFMDLPHLTNKQYYWIVENIESKLRQEIHPICGK
ncbi:MAG: hypothetical protein ACRCX2_21800 [Paraclostridium sp.]